MVTLDRSPDYLLQTKLYPPRVPDLLVRRQALLDRFKQWGDPPVTLVSAPAGYGKSTLVMQWLEARNAPYAWLSLDEYDTGLDTFLRYMIAALQIVVPSIGLETHNLLDLSQLPYPERLADMLVVDLQHLTGRLFLVLDDYHTVADEVVHHFVTRLLQRLPPELHLVIISRADPPLGLTRLRGKGLLREIRGSDLRFSPEEAAILIAQIVGRPVSEETANVIAMRTEGWPVALRMAAMSLQASDDHHEFTLRYTVGGQKLVSDYLLQEVLECLPDEQRLLLLRTAVVERLCAPLVDVLAGKSPSSSSGYEFLETLWSSNFFLIALDVQGTWYRYHHLFRELLLQQLGQMLPAETIADMHLHASGWFEEAGYVDEAIIHAVKAGRAKVAARLVEDHVHESVNEEKWRRVDHWINLLPAEARARPGILAIQAMIEQLRYRVETMIPLLDAAQEGLERGDSDYTPQQEEAWMGMISAFRATVFFPSNTPRDSLQFAVQALKQLDPAAIYVRSICELWHVYALQQSGEPQQAIRLARRKLAGQTGSPDVRTGRLMLAQCAVYYAEADLNSLRNVAHGLLDLSRHMQHQISSGWANFFLGWCTYQENKLEDAERYFSRVLDIRYQTHVRSALDSMTGLALTYGAKDETQKAYDVLQILREFILEQGAISLLPVADSLALRLDAHGSPGDLAHLRMVQPERQLAADLWELPLLTACRVDIAGGEKQGLDAAENALTESHEFARSRSAKRQLLRICSLQTLLYHARGDQEAARQRLMECLSLAEAGGVLRTYVDCGPDLIPYLIALRDQGVAPDYIGRILAAYPQDASLPETSASDGGSEQVALSATAVALLSELTNREMEVLLLLAERLTNKEIAARLIISPRTVKKHSINLYSKLGVENRRQAVAHAREVGII